MGIVVAITGASSGVGAATARLLASRGAMVVFGARREAPLVALTSEINEAGDQAAYRQTDVTKRADLEALVAHATARFGRLDVMVNNAGIGPISNVIPQQESRSCRRWASMPRPRTPFAPQPRCYGKKPVRSARHGDFAGSGRHQFLELNDGSGGKGRGRKASRPYRHFAGGHSAWDPVCDRATAGGGRGQYCY